MIRVNLRTRIIQHIPNPQMSYNNNRLVYANTKQASYDSNMGFNSLNLNRNNLNRNFQNLNTAHLSHGGYNSPIAQDPSILNQGQNVNPALSHGPRWLQVSYNIEFTQSQLTNQNFGNTTQAEIILNSIENQRENPGIPLT